MPISSEAKQTIAATLDGLCKDRKTGVPGLVFVAVDKNGDELASHAAGTRGLNTDQPMDMETTFWIASCTKMIAALSCMQLVEQGKLKLDDANQIEELVPEIKKVQVIERDSKGKIRMADKKERITLRMLLNHTAGFGYTFFNPNLLEHGKPIGKDEFTGDASDILTMPLVNQPGSAWEYGTNLDWAGLVLERSTGMKLNDYMHKNVFEPLGLKHISMFPDKQMKQNLARMHQRLPDGTVYERDHIYRRPLMAETKEEKDRIFNSGGAGCFARPTDYVQILATLLNGGVSPKTGNRIIKEETVKQMRENQIPQFPDFARQGLLPVKPDLANPAPEIYPQAGNPPQGWGLSWFITIEPGPTGRGRDCAWWAGLANLFWWADFEKGVAGMIASQVLPFGDMGVLGGWGGCEKAIYDGLQK